MLSLLLGTKAEAAGDNGSPWSAAAANVLASSRSTHASSLRCCRFTEAAEHPRFSARFAWFVGGALVKRLAASGGHRALRNPAPSAAMTSRPLPSDARLNSAPALADRGRGLPFFPLRRMWPPQAETRGQNTDSDAGVKRGRFVDPERSLEDQLVSSGPSAELCPLLRRVAPGTVCVLKAALKTRGDHRISQRD